MNSKTTELLLDVLVDLVSSVSDQPRRILFKGVSDLSDAFRTRVAQKDLNWTVLVTGAEGDIVGDRNDITIQTLVVFYREEVRERESLNAFRQFNEDAVVETLVRWAAQGQTLPEQYSSMEVERLRMLLSLVYPSAESLANFLLAGKDQAGNALPYLGLFRDPQLTYQLRLQQWESLVRGNHNTAVLRWRDFLDRSLGRKDVRGSLGEVRVQLLLHAVTEPNAKQDVLQAVSYAEALRILDPPTRIVTDLLRYGLSRDDAESLIERIKVGTVDPRQLPAGVGPLPDPLVIRLETFKPGGGVPETESSNEVDYCLHALLRVAASRSPFPKHLRIEQEDAEAGGGGADIQMLAASVAPAAAETSLGGRIQITLSAQDARTLSVPRPGANALRLKVVLPERGDILLQFSVKNLTGRLEPFKELWPDAEFWVQAQGLEPAHAPVWSRLQASVEQIRDMVDPAWGQDGETDDATQPQVSNNPLYQIFDLLYLAHRAEFEEYLDAWLEVATLPWRAKVASKPAEWLKSIAGLLRIGLASRSDGSFAILPFHPLRLVWHRSAFAEIEQRLAAATADGARPLAFEPSILQQMLQPIGRPSVLFDETPAGAQRLVEASTAPFFSIFVPEEQHRRARAPLHRAGLKLTQFGNMWPFSLARLHIAFQPGGASEQIYQVLTEQADAQQDAAYRVRALVARPDVVTTFDRELLTPGDRSTDLLTQEYHESLFPRVDYAKGQLGGDAAVLDDITAHIAILVDAFKEEDHGFARIKGNLNYSPHWTEFASIVTSADPRSRHSLKHVHLSALPYHYGPTSGDYRELVYVPLLDGRPEYLRMLFDSLTAWATQGSFMEAVYYEKVHWDRASLERLHHTADWVILFDRSLDKSLFRQLEPSGIKLIDFYPALAGGYRLSVSSLRTDAVEWQLVQVLHQFFSDSGLNLRQVARDMVDTMSEFASGLLLKTLGGGSLAQELLGLYATYRSLIAERLFNPGTDWLVPLDDYQDWFGRRTQQGRRADLLVLRNSAPGQVEMLAVESKWYKSLPGNFVADEFGPGGQLRNAVRSLQLLFDPLQTRLDKSYWQKMLASLIETAPADLRRTLQDSGWDLKVDGLVYVHQYTEPSAEKLAHRQDERQLEVQRNIHQEDAEIFSRGDELVRLRLISKPALVKLLSPADN